MGYALFAQRKVSLVAQIADLQWQLMDIANQKHQLVQYEAVVADGCITNTEMLENYNIFDSLDEAATKFAELDAEYTGTKSFNDLIGAYTQELAKDANLSETERAERLQNAKNYALQQMHQEYVQKVNQRNIAVLESALDMKQKRVETRLTAMQQELQSVEQAEAQAIQNATPKYAGLG